MKNLKTFEELDPSTYRNIKNRTAGYPWKQFGAGPKSERERGKKMGRINILSKERFESELIKKFQGSKIKVYDSLDRTKVIDLEFKSIRWLSNWTYYNLDFKIDGDKIFNGVISFHGDEKIPYTLDHGDKLNFRGDIIPDDSSIDLLRSMFDFGGLAK